jgi:hypothetical protein
MRQEKRAWMENGIFLDETTAKKQRRESHWGSRRLRLHFQKLITARF